MKTAVLGMGRMGRALGTRLLDTGHHVTVWNRTPGRAGDLIERGATEAPDPVAATDGTDVVLSSLADDKAVLAVLAPDDQPLVAPGTTPVVDMSTVSPATARHLGELFEASFVASPIMGGPAALADGQAALAVAGPEVTVARLESLWSSISGRLAPCGADPGRAQVVKLINNYLLMAGVATLADIVAVAQAAGFDREFLVTMLGLTPTVAPALHNRVEDIVGGDHRGWFSTALGAKDVALFAEAARASGVEVPLADAVLQRYQAAVHAGLGDADIGAVVELLR